MLLGAVSAVQTPRLRAFETNERRMAEFSETMDPCFVPRCYSIRSLLTRNEKANEQRSDSEAWES